MLKQAVAVPTTVAVLALAASATGAPPAELTAPAATAAPTASAAASSRAANERAIRTCVNREREKRGLAPLRVNASLARAARDHAENMRRQGFFDHTDPEGRGPSERVERLTGVFSGVGENIGGGYATGAAACRAWMRSSGHRANILRSSYARIGTGYARGGRLRHYWVQVFATAPRG